MIDAHLPRLRARLLDWYDAHRRDLPWRSAPDEPARDPYQVWLSETMLQQTRVETVRPYYHRWLQRFPTLPALAAADPDDVLHAWEGLGYYSRARNLHRAVREVVAQHGGAVPDDPAAFRALPGVGRYTAGAVMSIAFGREEPIVDGNVRRVFARLADRAEPAEAELWALATALVRGDRPGDLNQALMELGATVCMPRSPRCDHCPLADSCAARAAGTVSARPARRKAGPLPHEHRVAAIIADAEGRVLIARRPAEGRLAGMWEFPGDRIAAADPGDLDAVARLVDGAIGVAVQPLEPAGTVDHAFTHVRLSYHAVRCRALGGVPRLDPYTAFAWVDAQSIRQYALPRAQRRIAALAVAARGGSPGGRAQGSCAVQRRRDDES